MRLICPKCEAHYDLDPGLIPAEGREVECSSCGHVWFQRPRPPLRTPAPLPPEQIEPAPPVQPPVPPPARPVASPAAPPAPAAAAPQIQMGPFEADEAPNPATPRRPLNESLLAVLREEAAREAKARQQEAMRYEFQEDLGLEEPPKKRPSPPPPPPAPQTAPRPQPAPSGPEAPQHASVPPAPPAADQAEFRAPEALPDPEALAQTLALPAGPVDQDLGPSSPVARPRGRFGLGLVTALTMLGLAAAAYLFAPRLAEAWPQAEPALRAYAGQVDLLRGQLAEGWAALQSMIGELRDQN